MDGRRAVNSKLRVSETIANIAEEENGITERPSSLPEPPSEKLDISERKKTSKKKEVQTKSFERYLADAYDVVQRLRKELMDKVKELKEYLLETNRNLQQRSKDKRDSLKLYHFEKNADFLVEKDIGEREGKEILQDKVDNILRDIQSLDGD